MKYTGRNLNLTSYDEIFQTEEARVEAFQEKVIDIPLTELHPFKNHLFKVTDPLNRKLEDYDFIAGTFIVCGLSEDDFDSLTPELAEKYREKFAAPEIFMKMGSHIVAIPVKPMDELHATKPKQKSTEHEL